MVTQCPQNIPS